MIKRRLVWFRNDLRLHDNETLTRAHEECSELLYCYCLKRSDFDMLDLGFQRMDINKFRFLEQSVL
jgi:deoxyribodipyrimidine photo-lyase